MRRCQPQILQGETEKDLVEKEEDQIVEEQSQDNGLVAEGPCALKEEIGACENSRPRRT